MPLDATTNPEPAKRAPRPPRPSEIARRKARAVDVTPVPVAPKRSHTRKPDAGPPKPDANAVARAELDATLAALLPRAKTAASRAWVTYAVATRAVSLNEAWRETSKRALVANGALADYAANPLPVGTAATIYADPLVTVGVKVVPQANRLTDVDAFFAELVTLGLTKRVVSRLRKKHMTDFAGAHIIAALLTNT